MNRTHDKLLNRIGLFLLLLFIHLKANAGVEEDSGVWGVVQGQGAFVNSDSASKNWLWWMEGQGRFFNDSSRLGQSLIRPGVGYKLSDNSSAWLGYAWIYTRPQDSSSTDEHRIWQQFSWADGYDWGNLFTRTRLEQRFLNNGDDTGWRFRQFAKYTHPLFSNRIYASIWDEVFVNINSTDWGAENGFGQNRAFAGIGAFVDSARHYRIELGYMNQFINTANGKDEMNHILSCNLFIRY